jgi:WD40 repeat protein
VAWHAKDERLAGSVGDDGRLCIFDIRDESKTPIHNVSKAHEQDINCLAFNPLNEYVLATGSADHTIAIWDLRNMTRPMSQLMGHTDQVFKVEWAPFNESILGSCSADRRVGIWDLSRIGCEQSVEDAEDGPPELLFLHGGHTSKVSDFSWCTKDEWSIASVAEDNVLQVWNPAEEIYAIDDDDDDDGDNDENEDGESDSDKEQADGMLRDDDLE